MSSALYEVADIDLSQKEPVMQNLVLLQKIIHPTPLRSLAFFLSYEPAESETVHDP